MAERKKKEKQLNEKVSKQRALKIFNFLFSSFLKIIGCSLTALFLFMGWLGITHEQPKDIDAFCEAKCDKNASDFSNCMDSCFRALGGSDLFQGIFIIIGCLGLFISLFIIFRQFEKLTSKP